MLALTIGVSFICLVIGLVLGWIAGSTLEGDAVRRECHERFCEIGECGCGYIEGKTS
jgi:hypothetical protein